MSPNQKIAAHFAKCGELPKGLSGRTLDRVALIIAIDYPSCEEKFLQAIKTYFVSKRA